MKTKLIIATIALAFSLGAYADSSSHAPAAEDHSKMDHSNMTAEQMKTMNMQGMDHATMDHSNMTPAQMQAMHASMEAEMIKIINTVDLNERKKLFIAHKTSMQSMQDMMMKSCSAKK